VETSRSRLKIMAKSSLIPPHAPPARNQERSPLETRRLESSLRSHNARAVRLQRYFRAPLCRFFSLVCRSLRALRLGLLMAKVPLP
jgi:hypothetical protein